MTAEFEARVKRAVTHPDGVVGRSEPGEDPAHWSARAVVEVVRGAFGPDAIELNDKITRLEGELRYTRGLNERLALSQAEHRCTPTQDAYDRACAALEKHRARADQLASVVQRVSEQAYRQTGTVHTVVVLADIGRQLEEAAQADAAARAAAPERTEAWPLSVPCPSCPALTRQWCVDSETATSNIGHVHTPRREAAQREHGGSR